MIKHELFAIQQRPEHIFQGLLLIRLLIHVSRRLVLFGIHWLTR